jgi:hypothetical protein
LLRLWLVNAEVSKVSIAEAEKTVAQLWSSGGKWKGSLREGWAAGAQSFHDKISVAAPVSTAQSPPPKVLTERLPEPELVLVETKRQLQNSNARRPILKGSKDYVLDPTRPMAPSVSFAVVNEVREYGKDHSSTMFWVKKPEDSQSDTSKAKPTKNDLLDALQLKPFSVALQLLEKGAADEIDTADTLQTRSRRYPY